MCTMNRKNVAFSESVVIHTPAFGMSDDQRVQFANLLILQGSVAPCLNFQGKQSKIGRHV